MYKLRFYLFFQLIGNSGGLLRLQISETFPGGCSTASSSDQEESSATGPRSLGNLPLLLRRKDSAREAVSDDEEYHRGGKAVPSLLPPMPATLHTRGNSADSSLNAAAAAEEDEGDPMPPRHKRPSPKKRAPYQQPQPPSSSPQRKSRQVNLSGTEELHLSERDISAFLHPALDELRKSIKQHNIRRGQVDVAGAVFRAVVGYLGTIEMPGKKDPDSDSSSSRLLNIRHCIRRLRVEKKVHTTVLMCIFADKVALLNHHGKKLAGYPAEEISFCGMCTDDKRFFGLVTSRVRKTVEEEEEEAEGDEVEEESSSCHVFMTETVSDPQERTRRAAAFRFDNSDADCSEGDLPEFPDDADPIIKVIMSVFGGGGDASSAPPVGLSPAAASQRSSSSNGGDSGISGGAQQQQQASAAPAMRLDHLEEEEEMSIGSGSGAARSLRPPSFSNSALGEASFQDTGNFLLLCILDCKQNEGLVCICQVFVKYSRSKTAFMNQPTFGLVRRNKK